VTAIIALLAGALYAAVTTFLNDVISDAAAQWLPQVLSFLATQGETQILFGQAWVRSIISFAKALAAEILVVRLVYEMVMHYLLLKAGEEVDPVAVVRRFIVGLIFIATTPWFAEQVLRFGNLLAKQVVSIGWNGDVQTALSNYFRARPDTNILFLVLLALIALILLVLVMFQMLVRTVEGLFLGITGPFLSVGIISANLGTFAVWWRELITIGLQHAAQMLMLVTSCALLTTGTGTMTTCLFVASLYVAWKTPAILKEYSYHSGVATGISSVASTAVSALVFRAVR